MWKVPNLQPLELHATNSEIQSVRDQDHEINLNLIMFYYAWFYFNFCKMLVGSNEPVALYVDASIKGLDVALFQNNKPIAFASKALTPAETRYATIERELLAVVYDCEKFHSYLYGRSIVVKTDHRLLEQIHKRNLMQVPPSLQRMMLYLQLYDCVVKYLPGGEMVTADTLSRLSPLDDFEVPDMNVKIHHLIRITPAKMEEFKEELQKMKPYSFYPIRLYKFGPIEWGKLTQH